MNSQNRIDPVSVAVSVPRQTPHREFGTVLADTLGSVMQSGVSLVGGAVGLGSVPTAAVSGLHSSITSSASNGISAANGMASVTGVVPAGATATGGAGAVPFDPNAPESTLLQQISGGGDVSSAAFLQLQIRMQHESQQFSAASNILKVRSDSAKAAINNIR